MMKHRVMGVIIAGAILVSSAQVFGNGFALYENSSRASAFCSAFVAQADDPSAVFFNPAGITQLEGTQVMTGANTYTADFTIKFEDGREESLMDETWIVPYFYGTHQVNEDMWLGLGVFSPFGLGNEYSEEWPGRYNVYNSVITCMEVNPNLVFKASDTVSIGVGVSVQWVEVVSESKIKPKELVIQGIQKMGLDRENAENLYEYQYARDFDNLPDIDQSAELDDTRWRFNLGIRYQPTDQLMFGLTYRSWSDHDLNGDVEFQNVPETGSLSLKPLIYDCNISAKLELPDLWAIGAAYKINDDLTVEADIVRTRWSRYNDLLYKFGNQLGAVHRNLDWNDANTYRLGMEYKLTGTWTARCGYLFDESPVPDDTVDYVLPDNDRHMFTLGGGWNGANISVDAHYAAIFLMDRDIPRDDAVFKYQDAEVTDGLTHQIGMNLVYRF